MSNRQRLYVGLAVSAGVCTSIGLFLYIRHRREIALSKTPNTGTRPLTSSSLLSSITSRRGQNYSEITSTSDTSKDQSGTVRFQSGNATIEVDIPGADSPLTPDQAAILVRFLDEPKRNDNEEQLQRALTTLANAATFTESQMVLANAGCIDRLRALLSRTDNETTQCKVLLALNNLVLNEYVITHCTNLVPTVIQLCRAASSKSLARLYGLNLLVNLSVLEYLHEEYMTEIYELGFLIESAFEQPDEALSAGKILVNLSVNKSNLETLLKLTGVDIKAIVAMCSPKKKSLDHEQSSKFDEILLRYLTFYVNLAETIVSELERDRGKPMSNSSWLQDPTPHRQGSIYSELFDHEKQMSTNALLRPQYASATINTQVKRLRQAMDTIRQIQFESTVSNVHDEFNQHDHSAGRTDASTPKKPTFTSFSTDDGHSLDELEREVNGQFDDDDEDDETILPGQSSPSDQSLSSFRSAYSTNENNTFASPEKSLPN